MDRTSVYDQRARLYEDMARQDAQRHSQRAAWENAQAARLRHEAEKIRAHIRRQAERTW